MEWRVGPDMTEVRVLCIPLEIDDGCGKEQKENQATRVDQY